MVSANNMLPASLILQCVKIGIRHYMLRFTDIFVQDRIIQIKVGDATSEMKFINNAVPQVSVLSSILLCSKNKGIVSCNIIYTVLCEHRTFFYICSLNTLPDHSRWKNMHPFLSDSKDALQLMAQYDPTDYYFHFKEISLTLQMLNNKKIFFCSVYHVIYILLVMKWLIK